MTRRSKHTRSLRLSRHDNFWSALLAFPHGNTISSKALQAGMKARHLQDMSQKNVDASAHSSKPWSCNQRHTSYVPLSPVSVLHLPAPSVIVYQKANAVEDARSADEKAEAPPPPPPWGHQIISDRLCSPSLPPASNPPPPPPGPPNYI